MTNEERAVLAHVVIDPDAWYSKAVGTFGQAVADKHLAAKVSRHKPAFDAAKLSQAYKTRAVRQQEEDAAITAELAARQVARDAAKAAEEAALDARIAQVVAVELAKRG